MYQCVLMGDYPEVKKVHVDLVMKLPNSNRSRCNLLDENVCSSIATWKTRKLNYILKKNATHRSLPCFVVVCCLSSSLFNSFASR